jgi:hypothetical protein
MLRQLLSELSQQAPKFSTEHFFECQTGLCPLAQTKYRVGKRVCHVSEDYLKEAVSRRYRVYSHVPTYE